MGFSRLSRYDSYFGGEDNVSGVSIRVVNSEDSNFPVSEVHNRLRNRIANILKIIG